MKTLNEDLKAQETILKMVVGLLRSTKEDLLHVSRSAILAQDYYTDTLRPSIDDFAIGLKTRILFDSSDESKKAITTKLDDLEFGYLTDEGPSKLQIRPKEMEQGIEIAANKITGFFIMCDSPFLLLLYSLNTHTDEEPNNIGKNLIVCDCFIIEVKYGNVQHFVSNSWMEDIISFIEKNAKEYINLGLLPSEFSYKYSKHERKKYYFTIGKDAEALINEEVFETYFPSSGGEY